MEKGGGQSFIVGLFNILSTQTTENRDNKYLNIADGVILSEALRYSVKKCNDRLGSAIDIFMLDIQDLFPPYSAFYFYPHVSSLYNWQAASTLVVRRRQNSAPFINLFPYNTLMDHASSAHSHRIPSTFSVVPTVDFEIEAILDILVRLEWRFVSVAGSLDDENHENVKSFTEKAFKKGVCIAANIMLPIFPNSADLNEAVNKLKAANGAAVVVLFTDAVGTRGLLRSNLKGYNFISRSTLRASTNEIYFSRDTAKGLLLLQHADTYDTGFKDYFLNLKLRSNRYSWFGEFWGQVFQCNIPHAYRSAFGWYGHNYNKMCSGNETLTEDIVDLNYALVKPVLNAVETIACALRDSCAQRTCNTTKFPHYFYLCGQNVMINSSLYIGKGDCPLKNSVKFNKDGYLQRKFFVLNYNGSAYKKVGSWFYNETSKRGTLQLSNKSITWQWDKFKTSSCYTPCDIGEREDRGEGNAQCCYKCQKCDQHTIVVNNTCIKCPKFQSPSKSRAFCVALPKVLISSQRSPIWLLEFSAIIGVILTAFTMGIFVKFRQNRVVKATGRELSFVIMGTVIICFSTSVIFFLEPSSLVCGVQKILLSQCLSACYIPLLLKTVRVYRVFQASKKLVRNPTLVGTKSQIAMCLLGIVANLLLGVFLIISQPATVILESIDNEGKVAVLCDHNPLHTITSLVPCIVLMLACTYFGYQTRHFPSNFNEAFRISITMYVSCFLWAIFVPLLYLFELQRGNVFMTNLITAGMMILLGFVNCMGIFGATLIQVLFRKDVRPATFPATTSQRSAVTENRLSTFPCSEVSGKKVRINLTEPRET